MDQQQVEPDYYIDRAENATFVRDEDGHDKWTMLQDREELFDFNLESEPILQVLCGKALEQARVEVLEDFECQQLTQHRETYKKLREAEVLYTQK